MMTEPMVATASPTTSGRLIRSRRIRNDPRPTKSGLVLTSTTEAATEV
jgi:hypothetical protein